MYHHLGLLLGVAKHTIERYYSHCCSVFTEGWSGERFRKRVSNHLRCGTILDCDDLSSIRLLIEVKLDVNMLRVAMTVWILNQFHTRLVVFIDQNWLSLSKTEFHEKCPQIIDFLYT